MVRSEGRGAWARWAAGGLAVGLAAALLNAGKVNNLELVSTVLLGVPAGLVAMIAWRWIRRA
jgi:hypothetical protein